MQSLAVRAYPLSAIGLKPVHEQRYVDTTDYTRPPYADRGCTESPSCLKCPLQVCIHDLPVKNGVKELRRAQKRARIMEALDGGMSVKEVAAHLGVSYQTINRAIQRESK